MKFVKVQSQMVARTLLIFTVEAYAVYVGFPRKGISRLMSNGGINTFAHQQRTR
jgi:hypothetical protein